MNNTPQLVNMLKNTNLSKPESTNTFNKMMQDLKALAKNKLTTPQQEEDRREEQIKDIEAKVKDVQEK